MNPHKSPPFARIIALALAFAAAFTTAFAETGPLIGKTLATGLRRPVFVTHAPGDNDRLFIVEQRELDNNSNSIDTARIKIYKKSTGMVNAAHFLTVSVAGNGNERGLFCLAFHPDYATNGFFYIHYSKPTTGETIIERYTVSSVTATTGTADPAGPDIADHTSALLILEEPQPQGNHNGGWMGFRPTPAAGEEGYLYIALGDGGGSGDNDPGHPETSGATTGNAQQPDVNLLGKMLRIDVGPTGTADDFPGDATKNYAIPSTNPFVAPDPGLDEIWAYGLRNPWRNSFDRQTNDLWIGDVGQNAREEIDFQPAASTGGENYGWRLREGTIATPDNSGNPTMIGGPQPPGNVEPILDYQRTLSASTPIINGEMYGRSVVGGYVYRGPGMPWLQGTYFMSDSRSHKISSLRYDGATITEWTDRTDELQPEGFSFPSTPVTEITSFGEDAAGELYIVGNDQNNGGGGLLVQITQNDWYLWRNQNFTIAELDDAGISGVDANVDGDDMNTVMEFVAGRDPKVADGPAPSLFTRETDGGAEEYLTLTLTRDPAAATVDLEGESGTDLTDFNTATTTVITDTDTLFKVRDNTAVSSGSRRFLRFKLTLP
jgi:glucose/arabinose dehydrogenase